MSGANPTNNPPERASLTCPLGLRFLDVAIGTLVTEGLDAVAWPVGNPQRLTNSIVTPSGNHAFHGLPGLTTFETSNANDPWNPPPATREFQVEVSDEYLRFLPCTFAVSAPVQGLAQFANSGSPPWIDAGAVPLFSAPWRVAPAGLAVVRAELHDLTSARPAAWAFVEAILPYGGVTRIVRGLADDAGRVALLFAYPEGQRRPFGSSPPAGSHGPIRQQWAISLRFFSEPTDEPEPAANYATRLTQPPADAWRAVSPITPLIEKTLTFGLELDLGLVELAQPK
jgi:hypothetical protein